MLEIGVGEGSNTVLLAEYAASHHATLTVVDPFPKIDLSALERRFPGVITAHQKKSVDVLPTLPSADIVLIDGDHNWYTVLSELRAIDQSANRDQRTFPTVFVHDVGWPYGRRDMYVTPSDIPEDARQPYAQAGVLPDAERLSSEGLNTRMFHAKSEGGPRNGIRTAVDEFLLDHTDLRYVECQGFHGLGILYAPQSSAHTGFETFLASLKPSFQLGVLIADLEQNRVAQEIRVQQLRRTLFHEYYGRLDAQKVIKGLRDDVRFLQGKVGHLMNTLSWRVTSPLRRAGELLRECRTRKGWIRFLRSLWRRLGSPFPRCARFLRHRVLGRAVPALPSREEMLRTQAQQVLSAYGGAPSLSVIVVARNNGPYLADCLRSILSQSVPPYEVIYADDGSTDHSVQIARSIPGVRVFAWKHQGVVQARNAAVKESTGSLLLHVDGDDMLEPGYIAEQLCALIQHPDAVFAYGGAHWFGGEAFVHEPPDWDIERLWKENYINTSSVMRRAAFEAAGGWQEGVGTLWDWHLWLRMARIGSGVRTNSMLRYRRHDSSWSVATSRDMDESETAKLLGRVRRGVAHVSICCIFGGRVPELLPLWMDSLAASIRAHMDTGNAPELIVLDHSCKHMDQIRTLAEKAEVFRSVLVTPYTERFSWTEEMERRHKVAMFLAKAYNRLLALSSGEVIWFVEDDVVVPVHAYDTLLRGLTDGAEPAAAVCGLYRNRHMEDWIANRVDAHGNVLQVDVSGGQPMPIDLAGTGCTMALRPLVPYSFQSHWRGFAPAHDWTWSEQIRRAGKQIILYPSVRCRHHTDVDNFV